MTFHIFSVKDNKTVSKIQWEKSHFQTPNYSKSANFCQKIYFLRNFTLDIFEFFAQNQSNNWIYWQKSIFSGGNSSFFLKLLKLAFKNHWFKI